MRKLERCWPWKTVSSHLNTIIPLASRFFFFYFDILNFLYFLSFGVDCAWARLCFVFGCVCVWYLTEIIIDKSPKYGGHFSLAPMVICRTVAPLYFCILLGTKKNCCCCALVRVDFWQHVRVKVYWSLIFLLYEFEF